MEQMPGHVIEKYLVGTLEVGAFTGSIDVLSDVTNPLRYAFFSLGIRELVNHVIDRLAPNSDVIVCEWWDDKDGNRTTPKRTEKMQYAIRGGLSDEFVADELKLNLSLITDKTQQAVDELSNYVHYDATTFNVTAVSGRKLVQDTLTAVQKFLEVIEGLKEMVSEAMQETLFAEISSATIDDVLSKIDVLSTHYLVEGHDIDVINVELIDYKDIIVEVYGYVHIEHQFGSDGDYRRGNGVRFERTYPFVINLQLDVNDPLNINIQTSDILIDTDSFYGPVEEEDLDDGMEGPINEIDEDVHEF